MANIIRKAKCSSGWINFVSRNVAAFFGQDPLPVPNDHPQLFTHLTTDCITDKDAYRVLEYMDLAMTSDSNEDSAVDDFIADSAYVVSCRDELG